MAFFGSRHPMTPPTHVISEESEGKTLAAVVRDILSIPWSRAQKLIEGRMVQLGKEVCQDPARRVHAGEIIRILSAPARTPPKDWGIVIRYLDHHLVVVEKPPGISSVRHPTERDWTKERKALSPTLEELVPAMIRTREGRPMQGSSPRLRVVHRLDKETSGLLVFARTVEAERGLGHQFRKHTVKRRYWAIVDGYLTEQTIRSHLVRDRGDGKRGSTRLPEVGKEAITHIRPLRTVGHLTILECRLETGRTHQIRIHLSERGHPVCGDEVYGQETTKSAETQLPQPPRLALHALELGFQHPVTGMMVHWETPLPGDLNQWLEKVEKERKTDGNPVDRNPPGNRGKNLP